MKCCIRNYGAVSAVECVKKLMPKVVPGRWGYTYEAGQFLLAAEGTTTGFPR